MAGATLRGTLRRAVNVALRGLFGSVDVDPQQGTLALHYRLGGAVALTYDPLMGFEDESKTARPAA